MRNETDNHPLEDWPLINDAANAARNNLTETHCVVPLPAYDKNGSLILPSRYKVALGGMLARHFHPRSLLYQQTSGKHIGG